MATNQRSEIKSHFNDENLVAFVIYFHAFVFFSLVWGTGGVNSENFKENFYEF